MLDIVIIFFFFIFLPVFLVLVVLNFPPFDQPEIRTIVTVALVLLFIIFLRRVLRWRRKESIKKEEWKESLQEGGIEEPTPFRDLEPLEIQKLADLRKFPKLIKDYFFVVIILITVLDVLFVLFAINYLKSINGQFSGDSINSIFVLSFFLVAFNAGLFSQLSRETSLYLDSRSQVFKVQGRIWKERKYRRNGPNYFITIRNQKFSERNFQKLPELFDSIKNEQETIIEYSPRTKHVWNLYETQDI